MALAAEAAVRARLHDLVDLLDAARLHRADDGAPSGSPDAASEYIWSIGVTHASTSW
ncbi:MAG: hypothetical protein U0838_10015 [Chloroflexota bacterium]